MSLGECLLPDAGDSLALIEPEQGRGVTYKALKRLVARRGEELAPYSGRVVFLGGSSTIQSVTDYLALIGVGAVILFIDPESPKSTLAGLSDAYRPALALGVDLPRVSLSRLRAEKRGPNTESVLLATSGSTGSPKFVRLTQSNIESNAQQIVAALGIRPEDRAFGHLPLFYSFGLSILNSHLAAGASFVLSQRSMLEKAFWESLAATQATSLSGVPYSFQMFERMGFDSRELPHLRELTQAGGWMAPELVRRFHDMMTARGGRLWIMYGQTEATARISVLDPSELPERAGSVGRTLPRARIWIEDEDSEGVGEIVVEGPQVMLGYAESSDDVSGRDELKGVLCTGDLGTVDDSGFISIVGRIKRIAKVYGLRVSLDDVERRLAATGRVAAFQEGDRIVVHIEDSPDAPKNARAVEFMVGLPPRSVRLVVVDRIPTTPAGKVDREALMDERSRG